MNERSECSNDSNGKPTAEQTSPEYQPQDCT
jgi:hypothetical protein